MVVGEDIIESIPIDIAAEISLLTDVLTAIGGIAFIYLVFSIINFFLSRKKNQEIRKINKNLEDIKRLLKNNRK